ncbi:hypothetical protein [Flagellimonas sp.]|uniref:hypothetical protein n=1 Tax=Flagellimonas sp. TaxID=2058762 RepID=UPI003B522E98
MTKSKINLLLLSLFLLFFSSCSFQFSEDFFADLEDQGSNALITVEPFENGISLSAPRTVSYSFNSDPRHRLYSINVDIDGQGILGTQDRTGSFVVNTDALSEGEHTLRVRYQYSSGTGSLADLNDLERLEGSISYTFTVDKSSPDPVTLTNVDVSDGTIWIRWEDIGQQNFDEAVLLVYDPEDNRILRQIELTPEDILAGEFNDTLSTDLELEYEIMLSNRYAESTGNRIGISLDYPSLRGQVINDSQYRVLWTEHPLYGNFDFYTYNMRPNNTFVDLSNRGGELIVDDDPVFGQTEVHSLNLQRENDFTYLHFVSGEMHFGETFEASHGENYVLSTQRNSIFTVVLDGGTTHNAPRDVIIHELDPETLEIVTSRNYFTITDSFANLTVDPISNNLILDLKDSTYLIDVNTLEILSSWNASDYTLDTYNIHTYYRNGFIIVEKLSRESVYIFDAATRNLLYQSNIEYKFHIADDGETFVNNNAVYRWDGNAFNEVLALNLIGNVSVHGVYFVPNQNIVVLSHIDSNPVIYDYVADTSQIIPQLTGIDDIKYDPVSDKLCMFRRDPDDSSNDIAYLYSRTSGVEKQLKVFVDFRTRYYHYLNEKLISNQGLYLQDYFN